MMCSIGVCSQQLPVVFVTKQNSRLFPLFYNILANILDFYNKLFYTWIKRGTNMPQLSLYVTQEQLLKIENEAHAENMSLSKWVVSKIMERIEPHYPEGWADLFGSVSAPSFTRPDQPKLETREAF